MEIVKVEKSGISGEILNKAVEVLRAGGVVMHATDTCYGLAVDVFSREALRRLYALKGMSVDKPVSMMVMDLEEAQKYAKFNDQALRLAEKFWPGPLTMILPRTKDLPEFFNSGLDSVGIRCPDSKISLALIKGFGGPLTTTSANVSGKTEIYKVGELEGLEPDLVLDSGELENNLASTIVNFMDGNARLLRRGDLVLEIEEFLY